MKFNIWFVKRCVKGFLLDQNLDVRNNYVFMLGWTFFTL